MNLICNLSFDRNGLRVLRFYYLDGYSTGMTFETDALNRVGRYSSNLTVLEISMMFIKNRGYRLGDAARLSLVNLAIQIFGSNEKLQKLIMWQFTDQTEEGQRLIEALSTSPINKLTELDLRTNPAWFEDQEYAMQLADFVSRQ